MKSLKNQNCEKAMIGSIVPTKWDCKSNSVCYVDVVVRNKSIWLKNSNILGKRLFFSTIKNRPKKYIHSTKNINMPTFTFLL